LKKLKPSGFLFENVYGLTGAQKGELWEEIKKAFSDAGFKIFWRILDAADFGVPQHRERVFIVGVKKGEYEFPRPTHGPDSYCGLSGLTPADALKGLKAPDTKKEFGGKYGHLLKEIPPGLNYSFFTSKLGHPRPVFAWRSKFSDFLYKADPNMPVRTIKASGGKYTGPLHWDNRHFTVDELKRLQTFPDGYKIAGNHGTSVKQLGNSVPPNLARILALSILDQVFRIPVPIKLQYLDPDEKLGFRRRKRDLTKYYQRLAMEHHKKTEKKDLIPDVGEYNLFLRMAKYFEIIEVTPDIGFFTVNVNLTETEGLPSLFIDFHLNELVELADKLEIKLFSKKWDLDLSFIEVKADLTSIIDWTKMWKGLEFVLKKKFGIDDLVQLRGYYQYKPSFSIELSNKSSIRDDLFRILLITVENSISGHILDSSTLAKKWEVDESKVLDIAKKLKEIGYEIRNHRTNPQIPEGHYLIPYPFPTLNSKSVQLNKKL
ncbi:DNA cytosine methyltransferase, partial [bacterium]|nr:DNA cytosine methyltransferase [bacterium]